MDRQEQDLILRDLLISSSVNIFPQEDIREITEEDIDKFVEKLMTGEIGEKIERDIHDFIDMRKDFDRLNKTEEDEKPIT